MKRRVMRMADIAKLAGVSPATVSRALNGNSLIPAETRERILEIARAHNYRRDLRARNLRLGRSHTVAAVFPQSESSHRLMSDPFYLEIMGPITDELARFDFDLLVSRARGSEEEWYQRYILAKRADGLLVLERDLAHIGVSMLRKAGVTFVVWGPELPNQRCVSVGGNSFEGAREAVSHLLRLGRRHIGFVGGDAKMVETNERLKGYRQALLEEDVLFREELIVYTDYTPESSGEAVKRLLEVHAELDAIFFCSDLMAVAGMEALRQRGLRVPDDISVIGYDDIPLATHCNPPLTTVRQEIGQGGRLMVQKLLELIEGQEVHSVTVPTKLVVRQSCGSKGGVALS